jgi:hypothetical protein
MYAIMYDKTGQFKFWLSGAFSIFAIVFVLIAVSIIDGDRQELKEANIKMSNQLTQIQAIIKKETTK